ncbi:pentapeptide repeat-containing protein [Sanguibacteroides justesenii]|uniref:Pentapeptide repeat-containing protein n=2 Tax=Porphyromonadaceae TaxID=171551 RepID=A0AB34R8N1_9PORP|nr:hypothetical protein IE90_00600 [Sanguibacteroides justesenii]PXZ43765.1 pentapeptide repeat-containing protein [Sanguibacteroides justesenii]
MIDIIDHLEGIVIAATILAAVIMFIFKFFDIRNNREKEKEYKDEFNATVSQLSSNNLSSQLSAAILLRRFLNVKTKNSSYFHEEVINVISALLRTLPSGILQKTLGDGLAYAKDLSKIDLQKTNMQDLYLGNKEFRIVLNRTDMYLADLSFSLLENIDGEEAVFYNAILSGCRIKESNFTKANFRGADLTNTFFKNVILYQADFNEAVNIPDEIRQFLVDGIYSDSKPFVMKAADSSKSVFFSVPSSLSNEDAILIKEYEKLLKSKGVEVFPYEKGEYSKFGQFNKVRQSVQKSSAMIVFGLKQINVMEALYRPGLKDCELWKNKWLPTPWNDIEIGMGLMKGIPILLVKDDDINTGAFDTNLSECFVATISSKIDCREIDQNSQFIYWLSKF